MRDKLQILTITLIALSLAMLIGLSQQLTQSHTYYVPNYALTEQEYQQVEQAKGTFVQVDVLKYGDNAVPYQRVVHCRLVAGEGGQSHVECYIDEVKP